MTNAQTISGKEIWTQVKIHKSLTTEDGLAQGQVASIMQDSKGYIWFGTFDGVSRWDGNNFMNIQTHNGLPASQILDLAESKDSTIYIASYGGGVLVYKNGLLDTINTEDGLSTNNIIQILSLRNGAILFAGDDGKITKLYNGKFENWAKSVNFPEYDVFDLHESTDGTIYFATENGLVIVKDNSCSIIAERDGLITNYLWSVNVDDEGTVYIGTNKGINKLSDGKISVVNFNGKPFQNAVFKIHFSKDGKIYYATNNGILVEDNGSTELITKENGLVSENNWSILEGKNGLLYFGSNGNGVSIYNPKEKLINFNKSSALQQKKIFSIVEGERGDFYFGTRNGLVKYSNNRFRNITSTGGERSNIIEVLYKNRNGNILLGTKSGLKIFKDESIKPYINNQELLNNEIYSIAETKSGKLFIGTRFGVFSVDDKKVKRIEYFDSLGSIYIMTILIAENEDILFGSFDKGIIVYDNKNYSRITTDEGLTTNRINSFHQRNDGTILIGTQKGLNILKDNKIVDTIDVHDGLNNNVIADINEDESERIFLSTYKGLNIIQNLSDTLSIRHITREDGLINNNCLIGASFLDLSGNLWIGTQQGTTKYSPEKDQIVRTPPKIYLTGIEIFNEESPVKELEETHQLGYDQNYIKFRYTGINLSAPAKIVYEYKLTNVDKNWIRSVENSVQYTSLDDGDYTFEVKARNEWGFWSEPVKLSFAITPVWWKTPWFTTALLLLFAGSLLMIYNRRVKNLEKETRAQEEFSKRLIQSQEEERKRIAAGLHDSLGQNLLVIKNRALLGIKNDKEDFLKEQLSEISSTASTTLDEVRQIAYNLHPYQLNRLGLTKAIKSIITNVKDSTAINFSDELENIDNLVDKNDEINIYRIVQENINNIVKHSEANNALVKILRQGNSINIFIEDDGKGFDYRDVYDESNKMKGFGLENIKKRITLLNGDLSLNSDNGTKVKIIIPIKDK